MTQDSTTVVQPPPRSWGRFAMWLLHMVLPLLGLWLFLAHPPADVRWEHQAAHFWLVLVVAAISVGLGVVVSDDARRHADARLFLVSLAFLSAAGFLGLHALATPGVVLPGPNAGFDMATPVGLILAAVFAAWSALPLQSRAGGWVLARQHLLRGAVAAGVAAWGVVSLAGWPPLDQPLPEEATGPLLVGSFAAVGLYATAAVRYAALHRRRPSVVLVSLITAFVLLAEAMLAVALGRNWHASWWQWHILMGIAFAFVAYSARVQYRREGTGRDLFASVALDETLGQVKAEYGAALEALVEAMAGDDGQPVEPVAARLGERFDLTERQVAVLARAAEAMAAEREQIERLAGLVAVGREASVIRDEADLLQRAAAVAETAFRRERLRVALLADGALRPVDGDGIVADGAHRALDEGRLTTSDDGRSLWLPLTVKGHPAGVLEVRRDHAGFSERDTSVLTSFASQLSIAVENARIYQRLDGLFRSYMSPDVATALLADPDQAALGGGVAEVTVLMADLHGFTSFSERTEPTEVVAMLNAHFGEVVPILLAEGGTVAQFIGDAVMALFNAPVRQSDHARRAVRAGLAMQASAQRVVADHPGWPRFRVGINTGPALIGNIGSAEFRNFTAIGDTVNLAARLESAAPVGAVVVGERTRALLAAAAELSPMGTFSVKGKQDPVTAYVVESLP